MFAVIIPAYNEAATLKPLIEETLKYTDNLIVIDDCSTDKTQSIIKKFKNITALRNEKNLGKGASLFRAMTHAFENGAEFVITLDGDGQHLPQDLPRFLEAYKKHPEQIIIGSRMGNKAAFPKSRYRANRTAAFFISWACGYLIDDSQSGYRLYPAALLKNMRIRTGLKRSFVFESEILIKAARKGIKSTPIAIDALYKGTIKRQSYYKPILDTARITTMVTWKIVTHGFCLWGLLKVLRELRKENI
ncbi:MAG: glycosyltransferase family 2 protein [Alphaproteobacteria bacterium]